MQAQNQSAPLKVDVKVVNVLATVRDKKGQMMLNLGKDDFALEEDGQTQTITYFSKENNLPLTLGLLVDTSDSQREVIDSERAASHTFLDEMMREQDKAFVIHFDRSVELLQDLTSSRDKLAKRTRSSGNAEAAIEQEQRRTEFSRFSRLSRRRGLSVKAGEAIRAEEGEIRTAGGLRAPRQARCCTTRSSWLPMK